jgi:crossover junction endodeoxyribonuclease RusA
MAPRRGKAAATLARPLPPAFEFYVQGPAISARAKNRPLLRAWTARVISAARTAWQDRSPPMTGDLEVYISEFSAFATRDRDNMAKPVLDAMQGIVYNNDRQVKNLHIDWRDIEGSYTVRFMSPVVAQALSAGEEFLWVRVSPNVPRKDLIR